MKQVAVIGQVGLSGSRMEKLADELIIEILHRLPLFSAQRLKLVCKRWYGLISSAYFAQRFAQKKDRTFALFLLYIDGVRDGNLMVMEGSSYPELKFMCNGKGLSLDFISSYDDDSELPQAVASCDDLLLCRRRSSYPKEIKYLVCNPVTTQWVQLPSPPRTQQRMTTVYNRCEALIIRNQCNYTVISIFIDRRDDPEPLSDLKIQAFCSESNEWTEKTVLACPAVTPPSFQTHGMLYNGLLFWKLFLPSKKKCSLMALDPFNLEIRPHFFDPPTEHEGSYNQVLGMCRGTLRSIQVIGLCLCVWDLKHYDHHNEPEWFFYCKISLPLQQPSDVGLSVLCCHPDDPDVVYIYSHAAPYVRLYDEIVSCNLLQGELHKLCRVSYVDYLISLRAYPCILPWKPTPVI